MDGCGAQQEEYDYWLYSHCGKVDKEGRISEQEYELLRYYAKTRGLSFYEDRCSFSATIWNDKSGSWELISGKKFSVSVSTMTEQGREVS